MFCKWCSTHLDSQFLSFLAHLIVLLCCIQPASSKMQGNDLFIGSTLKNHAKHCWIQIIAIVWYISVEYYGCTSQVFAIVACTYFYSHTFLALITNSLYNDLPVWFYTWNFLLMMLYPPCSRFSLVFSCSSKCIMLDTTIFIQCRGIQIIAIWYSSVQSAMYLASFCWCCFYLTLFSYLSCSSYWIAV
jgi:hypothetical protein